MDNSFIKDRTLHLLTEPDYGNLLQATHELADYFEEITGIGTVDIHNGKAIMLPSGKAISPGMAAHCLKEYKRTQMFLQGIYQAINDQLKQKETVHILYAGTGPYGTLITPLLTLFTPQQIRLNLMDINSISLDALKKLYSHLQLEDFVDEYILADAATYVVPDDMSPDMMISETMLSALRKEPQVSVMQNLAPQLKPGGIFIPEQIKVSAWLINGRAERAYMEGNADDPKRIFLKDVYTLSLTSLPGEAETTVSIPQNTGNNTISLLTDIWVYKDKQLTFNNSSLNLPMQIAKVTDTDKGRQINFKYIISQTPGFIFSIN